MRTFIQAWVVLGMLFLAIPAGADQETELQSTAYPPVPLADILDSVSKKTGRVFLTGPRVPADVVVGQLMAKDITYSSLLIVLYNNSLAAVTVGDITNIMVAPFVRTAPIPILYEDDDSVAEFEWVRRVIRIRNGHAPQYVPLLRPLLPQMAHLVADKGSNSLVIVGRYGNTKRLDAIIRAMDERTTPQP